ncbi:ABCA1 [Bugula neritina]|uniref:ABCA1 n=1 Tax=Bugula neritina TaxID=10212 RepID=A0A7J7JNC4_BUGNE|nr:ABCA1 [Bugula neritina]
MNTDKVDDTDQIEDKYWQPRPRARPPWDTKYITFGFAYLQDMIEHSLIELLTNDETKVGIYLQQFPFPCYNVDFFMRSISRTLPLFMVLSWIFSVALLVKSIVYEKQERLKEQMKIMGLTNGIHWVAWYTVSIVLIAPSIFFLCVIFKHAKILQHSDPSIMGLLLFAFSFATTGQAFLFSVFFTKANLAACCGAIFYFTLYLPYAVVNQYEQTMTDWMKGIACLLSPVAFGLGTTYVSRFEEQGVGIQWDNISKSPLPDDTYSLSRCIGMLFLDGILYCLIAWYKEYVFPGKYGMPKPFYFPFTKSFWCGSSTAAHNTPDQPESGSVENVQCEAEPTHLKLGVKLQNLRKVYSAGKKLAVDNLSLNFYEDQITSFLGHNGAGRQLL